MQLCMSLRMPFVVHIAFDVTLFFWLRPILLALEQMHPTL